MRKVAEASRSFANSGHCVTTQSIEVDDRLHVRIIRIRPSRSHARGMHSLKLVRVLDVASLAMSDADICTNFSECGALYTFVDFIKRQIVRSTGVDDPNESRVELCEKSASDAGQQGDALCTIDGPDAWRNVMRGLMRFVSALLLALTGVEASAQREISFAPYALPSSGTIALAVRQDVPQEGVFAELDAALGGALKRAVTAMNYRGDRDKLLELAGIGPYERVILVGTGSEAPSARVFEDVGGWVGQVGARSPVKRIEILWSGAETDAGAHLAFGAALGQYRFTKYRQKAPGAPVVGEGEIVIRTPAGTAAGSTYSAQWRPVADAVRYARDLITEPSNEIYPESFVERTREAFRGVPNVRIEVLDVPAMEKLGMGGMLAVGKGSTRPPRLLVVRYDGGKAGDAPYAFVGKGITFDSGGVSIKPNAGMWRMKSDMSGAAAATGTILALAGRKAPVNAVGIAALAENMPDGGAARPGDVVRTMSGKTFEIMSADAEGRMVLADAVWYAQQQFKPRVLIDLATLTGAAATALGDDYAGLFSRDDALAAQLLSAGEQAGELLWRLPLHPSYAKDLESPIADIRNGSGGSMGGGAGHGAHFIGAWIESGTPWAHLDIAPIAWRESEGLPTSPPGAVGFGIRALDRYVRMTAQ